jgi:hypothetical protein
MNLLRKLLKLGQKTCKGSFRGSTRQLLSFGQPRRGSDGHGGRVNLGSQLGPLLTRLILLCQKDTASFPSLIKSFLGSMKGLLCSLDSLILLLKPFLKNGEVSELTLK